MPKISRREQSLSLAGLLALADLAVPVPTRGETDVPSPGYRPTSRPAGTVTRGVCRGKVQPGAEELRRKKTFLEANEQFPRKIVIS